MENTGIQDPLNLDLNSDDMLRDIENFDNETSNAKQSQQKSWMIKLYFKCPVIGTCLSLEEQKKILKKTGYSTKNLSAFKIHQTLVESLENESDIATRIDAYLNRKFHRYISKYLYLDESSFLKEWKLHFEKGSLEGLLWVAATRADLSLTTICSIFGDIHMQMHLNSEMNRKERRHLTYQKEENRKLGQRLEEAIQINRGIKKEKGRLEKELTKVRSTYVFLEKEKEKIRSELNDLQEKSFVETLRAQNRQWKNKIKELSGLIEGYRQKVQSLEDQNNRLLSKLERQREVSGHFRKEPHEVTSQISALDQSDDKYPFSDLEHKRVLIVGGMTKLKTFYRKLIEEKGGIFEYHDGYMNGGSNGLESKLRGADVVLCPVNCNSHA
ncbi:MAG: DUF2325 domain-containing protein, partial [Candidatus Omnitrophica bacterium]|nr:DUF2325 domain-containing protein [Candidatus Omnitrophota bacterium]